MCTPECAKGVSPAWIVRIFSVQRFFFALDSWCIHELQMSVPGHAGFYRTITKTRQARNLLTIQQVKAVLLIVPLAFLDWHISHHGDLTMSSLLPNICCDVCWQNKISGLPSIGNDMVEASMATTLICIS